MPHGGLSLAELTDAVAERSGHTLRARVIGDPAVRVARVATLAVAGPADLAFLSNPRYRNDAAASGAGAIVLSPRDDEAFGPSVRSVRIVVENPYAWFAFAAQLLVPAVVRTAGIDPTASVDPDATVAANATIGPNVSIRAHARIGQRAVIDAGAVVGSEAQIGDDAHLYPNAVVLDRCVVGERTIIHSGAIIGADGFGFAPHQGRYVKIPQVGRVVIGADVEIGANTTIDRGTMEDTIIEDGVKLDNQIQVGHNCTIGAHTVIAGCVGIAGSTHIGRGCQIGGAAMFVGHIRVADGSVIGGGALVDSTIVDAGHYSGSFPIMTNRQWKRAAALIRQLDELRKRIRDLEAEARKDTP